MWAHQLFYIMKILKNEEILIADLIFYFVNMQLHQVGQASDYYYHIHQQRLQVSLFI